MRKLTVLTLALLYVISLAAVSAFAANAARVSDTKAHMVPIESRNQSLVDNGLESSSASVSKGGENQLALGYLMTGISPGIELGITTYDLQHNMRMARQAAAGADGRIHFVWTRAPYPFDAGARRVFYRTYKDGLLDESFNVSESFEPAKTPGRFCTVDVFQNRGFVVNHYANTRTKTTSALDIASAGYTFTAIDCPDTVNCQAVYAQGATALTFQGYIWPVASTDQDGTGKLVVHVAASEGNTAGGSWSGICYYRGVSSGVTMDVGMYGTCGLFIDSCQATGYDIAADPYSDRVVIAYPKARQANRENNDLCYVLSTDMGATWGAAGGSSVDIHNVTNFAPSALERCAGDMSVLFTADNNFHIIYVGNIYDSVAGTVSDQEAKLWHWSSSNPTQRSMVLDANNHDDACNTPAFEYNVCKVNLTQCITTTGAYGYIDTLLYAVYSRQLGKTGDQDCSDLEYFNQEVFMSPSSTWGETWGAPVNLTNTKTNGCLSGACADDGSSSSPKYVVDSLRIEYLEDLDAGSNVGNESGTASNSNPIKFITYPCIAMEDYRILTATPSRIKYPFHAVRNATANQTLVLVNGGNQPIEWTSSILGSDVSISLNPSTGTCPAGYSNSDTTVATVGPKADEGLFQNTIRFSYEGGATLDVAVDFYVFDSWFLKEDIAIRTANNRMVVNQVTQAANDVSGSAFTFFADLNTDYITDGSLILGNSADDLSWRIFESGQGDPTPTNNYGWTYALTHTTVDSTTYPSSTGYTIAQGSGVNRDSTVGYDVKWYAPHHVDSADFYVGHFEIYKGSKWVSDVTGLDIAYGCDWDVPSDSGSDNTAGYDADLQMIYLQGQYTAARQQGFAALAAYREDDVAISGGFAWGNDEQVYPNGGFHVDSVWKYMQATTNYNSIWLDSVEDQSIVMVVAKNYTVTSTSRLIFDVVIAGKRAETNTAGYDGLVTAVDKARAFICSYINPDMQICASCEACGDADGNGSINISDAVFLIAYIFAHGTAPGDCNYTGGLGDADGNGTVNISDAVYLIAYIFAHGSTPHCQGM